MSDDRSTSEDSPFTWHNLAFSFTMLLLGIVTVEMFSALYEALRISFKDIISGNDLIGSIQDVWQSLGAWRPFINPAVRGVSSVALTATALFNIVIYFMVINRLKFEYQKEYKVIHFIFDWYIAFSFFCIAKSISNLHEKFLTDTDTTWMLFLSVYLMMIVRVFFSGKTDGNNNDFNRRVAFVHYLCLSFLITVNSYVYDLMPLNYTSLLIALLCTVAIYLGTIISAVLYARFRDTRELNLSNRFAIYTGSLLSLIILLFCFFNSEVFVDLYHFGKRFSGPWPGLLIWLNFIYLAIMGFVVPIWNGRDQGQSS